jgi:AcrR family transcriptional regulator
MESRRGRPRNLAARAAILSAAYELLQQGGIAAVTIEAVAARAGVGRPTVYRWWPNANAVAMAALMERSDESAAETKGTSAIATLRRQLRAVAEIFSQPVGRSVASMLAASEPDTELSRSFRNHFIFQRREEARTLLTRAMRDGEIRPRLDLDTVLDLLYGPLFYRLIAAQGSLQRAYADRILDLLLEGISTK